MNVIISCGVKSQYDSILSVIISCCYYDSKKVFFKDVANYVLMCIRLNVNPPHLVSEAFSRLQKELDRDGRDPKMFSKGKSLSRRGTASGISDSSKGNKHSLYKSNFGYFLLVGK